MRNFNMRPKLGVNLTDGSFVFLLSPVSPKDGNRKKKKKKGWQQDGLCGCEVSAIHRMESPCIFLLL